MFDFTSLKKIISWATWGIFLLLFFFTIIVAVAQRSLPGDSTYGVKFGLEKFLIGFYGLFGKEAVVGIDFTQTRYDEFQQVASSDQSLVGLKNLEDQIKATGLSILNTKDEKQKAEAAQKYIALLRTLSAELEADKNHLKNINPDATPTPLYVRARPTPTVFRTSTYTYQPPTPTIPPPPTTSTRVVTTAISQTQSTIQTTINTLTTIPPPTNTNQNAGATPTFAPTNTPPPTPTPTIFIDAPNFNAPASPPTNTPGAPMPTNTPIPTSPPPATPTD